MSRSRLERVTDYLDDRPSLLGLLGIIVAFAAAGLVVLIVWALTAPPV